MKTYSLLVVLEELLLAVRAVLALRLRTLENETRLAMPAVLYELVGGHRRNLTAPPSPAEPTFLDLLDVEYVVDQTHEALAVALRQFEHGPRVGRDPPEHAARDQIDGAADWWAGSSLLFGTSVTTLW